ncbi:hypothetical protein ANCCAN_25934 [Ancylostoma caninum]|uniref:Uncharacterized protein n=1 Tax=Ancylostoma caninum TaxID=29170 RepID=A0A368F828_ANCCA|nr:hypothetical protein ANCCAN_25934 [Ancylostoma caninum]
MPLLQLNQESGSAGINGELNIPKGPRTPQYTLLENNDISRTVIYTFHINHQVMSESGPILIIPSMLGDMKLEKNNSIATKRDF